MLKISHCNKIMNLQKNSLPTNNKIMFIPNISYFKYKVNY